MKTVYVLSQLSLLSDSWCPYEMIIFLLLYGIGIMLYKYRYWFDIVSYVANKGTVCIQLELLIDLAMSLYMNNHSNIPSTGVTFTLWIETVLLLNKDE